MQKSRKTSLDKSTIAILVLLSIVAMNLTAGVAGDYLRSGTHVTIKNDYSYHILLKMRCSDKQDFSRPFSRWTQEIFPHKKIVVMLRGKHCKITPELLYK